MNVTKFSLISNGYIGIRVSAVEAVERENVTMLDHVVRERRYQIPKDLREKINGLKYFFLNLTGHWISPFNKYFDINSYTVTDPEPGKEPTGAYNLLHSLLNHTQITGVSTRNAGFCISGTIDITDDKKIAITTPFVTEEDDVSFFVEAQEKIMGILESTAIEMTTTKAVSIDAREVAKAIKMHDADKMNEKEVTENVIEKLQQKGFFVMKDENPDLPKVKSDYRMHTGTSSIDSHKLPQSVEVKEDDNADDTPKYQKEKKVEKKDIGRGTLASEKNFPILDDIPVYVQKQHERDNPSGGSLEIFEHSENMGIPREEPPSENVNQGEW